MKIVVKPKALVIKYPISLETKIRLRNEIKIHFKIVFRKCQGKEDFTWLFEIPEIKAFAVLALFKSCNFSKMRKLVKKTFEIYHQFKNFLLDEFLLPNLQNCTWEFFTMKIIFNEISFWFCLHLLTWDWFNVTLISEWVQVAIALRNLMKYTFSQK